MGTLEKLRKRRGELQARAEAIIAAAEANEAHPGEFTDEQTAEIDQIEAELKRVDASIDRHTRLQERMDAGNQSAGRATSPTGAGQPGSGPVISEMHDRREDDAMCGYRSYGQFARDVRGHYMHSLNPEGQERLRSYLEHPSIQSAATNFHHGDNAAESGIPVMPAMRAEIWELVFDDDDLLGQIDMEPTESSAVQLDADESTPWGTTGVQARRRSQGAVMTNDLEPPPEPRILRLEEMYAFVLATDEQLEDQPRLQNRLTTKAARAIKWASNDEIVNGTGVGQALGYMNAGCLVTVAKEGSQTADTIVANNVAKMFSRLWRVPGGRAQWRINPDALPQLMTMTLGDQPIWTPPATGFANAPGGFLLGLPVIPSEHNQTVGDLGDITLIDPMAYYGTQKAGGTKADQSIHLYFDQGITAFRWTIRWNGQPYQSKAVTPPNSTATRSAFVALAARA